MSHIDYAEQPPKPRVAAVWHMPLGGSYPGNELRVCIVCGEAWPCRARRAINGGMSDD